MTMLEKAARAAGEVPATMADDVRDVLSEAAIERVARAVLVAVREPNDAMQLAGYEYAPNQREQFTAMIDAILDGK